MKRLSARQVLASVLLFATSDAAWTSDAPAVNSTSGLIIGHEAKNRPATYEFLGIKYGQAPIGELRFAAPQRYLAPEGTVFEASDWVNLCLSGEIGISGLIQTIERRLPV